jgi:bifunctional DNA-binding transcriptional regulator/antitoxin component of YhaV-PrlF toxin-antitoxin module
MRTKISKRRQMSVPSKIRKRLHIGTDRTLESIVEGAKRTLIQIPADPVRAFRGSGKKGLVKELLKERRRDRQPENAS